MINHILDKAQAQIEQGRLWRAKEILQGAIRSESYDIQLFEIMGVVLLKMGDLPEAGKFLFLSGVRRPEYQESIEIFLGKHQRRQPRDFLYLLPRKARLRNVSDYPDQVAQVLRQMGFPEVLKNKDGKVYIPEAGNDRVIWITCGTIAVITVVLIILGLIKLREIIR